jgi:TetR/AcrR family transcriptional regulator, cholesterol catabolism regulator
MADRTTANGEGDARDAVSSVRADIVAAATRVFSERGYHGASMDDVADALGMRKPSLYHHIRKKEDLLFAIHERLIDELIDETESVCSSAATPSAKVHDLLLLTMRFIARNKDGVTVFLQERRAVGGDRWESLVAKRDRYERMVSRTIAEGIAAGDFVDLPPDIAARGVLAMANWGYTWFQPDGRLTAEEVAEIFAAIVLSGLEHR